MPVDSSGRSGKGGEKRVARIRVAMSHDSLDERADLTLVPGRQAAHAVDVAVEVHEEPLQLLFRARLQFRALDLVDLDDPRCQGDLGGGTLGREACRREGQTRRDEDPTAAIQAITMVSALYGTRAPPPPTTSPRVLHGPSLSRSPVGTGSHTRGRTSRANFS